MNASNDMILLEAKGSARNKDAKPNPTYTFYYDGKEKIIFEPNSELVAAVKAVAPRKVFTD